VLIVSGQLPWFKADFKNDNFVEGERFTLTPALSLKGRGSRKFLLAAT
jgi:hypothetical protein